MTKHASGSGVATDMVHAELIDRMRERRRKMYNGVPRSWYDIRNADGDVAEIRIYDEIGFFGITADQFVGELEAITAPEIRVAINSPGGDVFDAVAIYHALLAHPAKVTTRVDSLAASAASVILQAGDNRVMFPASQVMIHDAWGMVIGNAAEMREMADLLDMESDLIAGIYAARAGSNTAEDFRALMRAGTWMTAEQAVDQGLADEVVEARAQDSVAKRTLSDEIADAMGVVSAVVESAERVAALRAEKGKHLSASNQESLDGLKRNLGRLAAVLTTKDDPATPAPEPEVEAEAEAEPATEAEAKAEPKSSARRRELADRDILIAEAALRLQAVTSA